MDARWGGSTDFAEVAEALRINTDEIVTMIQRGRDYEVFYCLNGDVDTQGNIAGDVYAVSVGPDTDNILVMQHRTLRHVPDFWEKFNAILNDHG